MSRGIVVWPDDATATAVRQIWDELAAAGLPSHATHTHRLHRPHVSFTVAEDLPLEGALAAIGRVPRTPIRLLLHAAGVFPGGVLFLSCVPVRELLDEQARVHAAVRALAVDAWPQYTPERWTPHLTIAVELDDTQLAQALPLVIGRLPILGWLDRGGVEDGSTGERWSSTAVPEVA